MPASGEGPRLGWRVGFTLVMHVGEGGRRRGLPRGAGSVFRILAHARAGGGGLLGCRGQGGRGRDKPSAPRAGFKPGGWQGLRALHAQLACAREVGSRWGQACACRRGPGQPGGAAKTAAARPSAMDGRRAGLRQAQAAVGGRCHAPAPPPAAALSRVGRHAPAWSCLLLTCWPSGLSW